MNRHTPRSHRGGHSHIEFALVLPVLLMFIYGIMEYGWMFFQRTAVQEAARQGCRAGATMAPDEDYDAVVQEKALSALESLSVDCQKVDCTVTTDEEGALPEMRLRCEVAVEYKPLLNVLPTPATLGAGYLYYFEQQ
jgi:Flp pilus assembly protein TadG